MGGTEHTQHTFDSLTAVSQSREWDSDILLCVVGVAVRCPIAKESHDLIYKRLPESELSWYENFFPTHKDLSG